MDSEQIVLEAIPVDKLGVQRVVEVTWRRMLYCRRRKLSTLSASIAKPCLENAFFHIKTFALDDVMASDPSAVHLISDSETGESAKGTATVATWFTDASSHSRVLRIRLELKNLPAS